jgi:hypothetical protein
MGSQSFTTYARGKNANDAYNRAVEDAEDEYGHQEGYSGAINSAGGFADVTKEFKASKKSLDKFIDEQIDKLTKFDGARAVCIEEPIENKNTIKSQVEHIVTPGTKKWVLKYVVQHGDHHIGGWDTKREAVKDARRYTEQNQVSTKVVIKKFIEKGDNTVAKITYKPSSTEKEGKWVFFGWASC